MREVKWRDRLSHVRSLLWYLPIFSLATAACGAVSLAAAALDGSGRWPHRIARFWARLLLFLGGISVQTIGEENLPRDRPCLLVCNHLSYMDIPVIFARVDVPFRIMAREDLFRFPFLGWHLRRAGHLPVDREHAPSAVRSVRRAAEIMRRGLSVFVFPEGGRSMNGVLQEFLPGAFYLAMRARAPIVPLALAGTRELLPPNSLHLRPRPIRLTILPPVATDDYGPRQLDRLAAEVRGMIAAELAAESDAATRPGRPRARLRARP